MMAPVLKEIEEELKGRVEVVEINVDENMELSQKYNVLGIPTYIVEKVDDDGKKTEIGRKVGVTPKAELLKLIVS